MGTQLLLMAMSRAYLLLFVASVIDRAATSPLSPRVSTAIFDETIPETGLTSLEQTPQSCAAGEYNLLTNGAYVCTACDKGSYQSSSSYTGTACTGCTFGTYTNSTGSTSVADCIDCSAGKNQVVHQSVVDIDCISAPSNPNDADVRGQMLLLQRIVSWFN